ncbi:MAG TPA: hypothetical protein VFA68_05070 [Terriglobales bacterium]|nr:hypothetical protein [Terriglobales bacterium]
MFAIRLVQLIEARAEALSEGLAQKLKSSERCGELLRKVPPDELKRRSQEIYRNLTDWVLNKTEAEIEDRYIGLGMRRARQGVPFPAFLWAVTETKEYLFEFLRREGFLDEPVELIGEIELMHSLEHFFNQALYFAAVGYEYMHQSETHTTAEQALRKAKTA